MLYTETSALQDVIARHNLPLNAFFDLIIDNIIYIYIYKKQYCG